MRVWMAILAAAGLFQAGMIDPRHYGAPYIATAIEQLDGSAVSFRYSAVPWDSAAASAVLEDIETRDFFNSHVLSNLGTMKTNVQLTIGEHQLGPGGFVLGIWAGEADGRATLSIAPPDGMPIRIPVPIRTGGELAEHFSVEFAPGVTDRDFRMHGRYGPYALTLNWQISGIPQLVDAAAQDYGSGMEPPAPDDAVDPAFPPPGAPEGFESISPPAYSPAANGTATAPFPPIRYPGLNRPPLHGLSADGAADATPAGTKAGSGSFRTYFQSNPFKYRK